MIDPRLQEIQRALRNLNGGFYVIVILQAVTIALYLQERLGR